MADTELARGSMGANRYRERENQPTHTGNLTITEDIPRGAKVRIAAWPRINDADQSEFFSLKLTLPDPAYAGSSPAPAPVTKPFERPRPDLDDRDIPF